MHDMLVKLYAIPGIDDALAVCAARGVTVRRALAPERPAVLELGPRVLCELRGGSRDGLRANPGDVLHRRPR